MSRLPALILVPCLIAVVPLSSAADEKPRGPCRADVEKLCQGVERERGAIARCLKQNESALSTECKDAMAKSMEKAREKAKALAKVCKEDAEQYCKDVNPGRGRIVRCLQQNADKLSEACRAELPKRKQKREE